MEDKITMAHIAAVSEPVLPGSSMGRKKRDAKVKAARNPDIRER
jgi:hypothetical protein